MDIFSGLARLKLLAAISMVCVETTFGQTICLYSNAYDSFDGGLPPDGTLVATATQTDGSNTATWTTTQVSGTSTRPIYQQLAGDFPRVGVTLGGGVQDVEITYLSEMPVRVFRISDLAFNFESYIITGYTAANTPVFPVFLSKSNGADTTGLNNNQIFDSDGGAQANSLVVFLQPIASVTFENVNLPPVNGSFVVIQELGCPLTTSLKVTKDASAPGFPAGDLTEVPVGTEITYVYTVENTGSVPLTDVQLNDTHNASGPVPMANMETLTTDNFDIGDSVDGPTDGVWDVLGPGDTVRFEGTYTVTQSDIDTLQAN